MNIVNCDPFNVRFIKLIEQRKKEIESKLDNQSDKPYNSDQSKGKM